jgi:hypothetical protein
MLLTDGMIMPIRAHGASGEWSARRLSSVATASMIFLRIHFLLHS